MQHDFTQHETGRLIRLKSDLITTARNKHTNALQDTTRDTIRQIDLELSKRGLEPIVKRKTKAL